MKKTKQSQIMSNFKKSRGYQTKNTSTLPQMTEFLPTIRKQDSYDRFQQLPRYGSAAVLPHQPAETMTTELMNKQTQMTFGGAEQAAQTITIKPTPLQLKQALSKKSKKNSMGRNLESLFNTPYQTNAQSPKQSVQESINQNKFGALTDQSGQSIEDSELDQHLSRNTSKAFISVTPQRKPIENVFKNSRNIKF